MIDVSLKQFKVGGCVEELSDSCWKISYFGMKTEKKICQKDF